MLNLISYIIYRIMMLIPSILFILLVLSPILAPIVFYHLYLKKNKDNPKYKRLIIFTALFFYCMIIILLLLINAVQYALLLLVVLTPFFGPLLFYHLYLKKRLHRSKKVHRTTLLFASLMFIGLSVLAAMNSSCTGMSESKVINPDGTESVLFTPCDPTFGFPVPAFAPSDYGDPIGIFVLPLIAIPLNIHYFYVLITILTHYGVKIIKRVKNV